MPRHKRIWPIWARTIGDMADRGAVVRMGCAKCRTLFDVDLRAVAERRGREFSLIDATSQCKATSCRGRAYFIGARSMTDPMVTLTNSSMDPFQLNGLRPIDVEPPDEPEPTAPAACRAA